MGNAVTHFEVVGKDGAALQQFYSEAFGWRMNETAPGYAMALTDADGINRGVGDGQGGQSHVTFYIEVDDLDEALKTVESLGGSTLMPPLQIPNGPNIAMFSDPEGHVIGLAKARPR